MISCLLVALIHVRLDLLLYFMFISFIPSLSLNLGLCVLLLISCDFGWPEL